MHQIGVIIGTTRDNRFADKVAAWFMAHASDRPDLAFELIDLRDYPMPFFNEKTSDMWAPTKDEVSRRWQAKLAEMDGFVILVAEYNHGPSGVLKNALDYAYKAWVRKPVAFVGYGAVGAARAVEQLRLICIELQMAPVRSAVHLQGGDFRLVYQEQKTLDELEYLTPLNTAMLDDLAWWTGVLKAGREKAISAV